MLLNERMEYLHPEYYYIEDDNVHRQGCSILKTKKAANKEDMDNFVMN
jgi:hypothetical protein